MNPLKRIFQFQKPKLQPQKRTDGRIVEVNLSLILNQGILVIT